MANFSPLIIWDVGLGAATNAMAAVNCYEAAAAVGPVRPLHIVSFENDLDPLRLAIRHNREFTYLRHPGPAAILEKGRWERGFPSPPFSSTPPRKDGIAGEEKDEDFSGRAHLSWTLLPGDFTAILPAAPAPDLIFFDMFSSKTSGAQWTLAVFHQIFAACAGRAAELYTYSCSTPVRAALLAAGFHVARGCSTGDKIETTIALTPAAAHPPRHALLGVEWLSKWQRSGAKFPADLAADDCAAFEQTILSHPQFLAATAHDAAR